MGLMDATERARPIMEYVRHMENTVRRYRAIETRFKATSFAWGLGAGAFLGFAAGAWLRWW